MFKARYWPLPRLSASLVVSATCLAAITLSGCERKERVVDIETPVGDVEVDRNIDTGEVEVKVNERERRD
jgi:hypothetical protein